MSFYGNIFANPHLELIITKRQGESSNDTLTYDLTIKDVITEDTITATTIELPIDTVFDRIESDSSGNGIKVFYKYLDGNGNADEETQSISFTNLITTASIQNSAVTTAKIAAENVTAEKIGPSAVTEGKIGADAVTTSKIKNGNVTKDKLASGAVTEDKIGTDAVTTVKIVNKNITTEKIADNAVTWNNLNEDVKAQFATCKYDSDSGILSLINIIEEASE